MLIDSTESERNSPEGLGGWLILLLLEIWLNAAARLAAGIASLAVIFRVAVPSVFAAALAPFPSAVAVAAGLFGAVAGFFLARKSPRGTTLAKALLSLDAGYYLLSLLVIAFRTGPVAAESLPGWLKPAALCLASIVSLGYLLRSRRVKNTYAPRPQGPNPAEVFHDGQNSDVLRNRIFPWEEFRSSETPIPAAQEPGAPALAASDTATHELAEPAAHHSRIFRDEPVQPFSAEQAQDVHMPSIPRPEPVRIEPRKEREVWPTHRFTPERHDPATGHARLFHDEVPGPAQHVPPVQVQNNHLSIARKLAPQKVTPLMNEESWPPPQFAPVAPEPAHHQSRIFSRESMLGPAQLVPAPEDENTRHPSTPNPELRTIEPLAREAWPAGTFVPETPAPVSHNGDRHPVNPWEPRPQVVPESPQIPQEQIPREFVPRQPDVERLRTNEPGPREPNGGQSEPRSLQTPAPHALQPDALQPGTQPDPEVLHTPEPNPRELDTLKAQIATGVTAWLASTTSGSGRPSAHAALLDEAGAPLTLEEARQKLLDQIDAICDQAWSVCIGQSPPLPTTADSAGSLPDELQKWAIAQAAFRLPRSLDIRAAMEVNGPFERVANDREYLMAIALKNSSEDAFGRKVDLAEYNSHPGPEIAYRLILRAQRDMFEADMWAHVADLAGDPDFRNRLSSRGSKAFQESREYWSGYASRLREDRASLFTTGAGFR